jgi:hypothetical protein
MTRPQPRRGSSATAIDDCEHSAETAGRLRACAVLGIILACWLSKCAWRASGCTPPCHFLRRLWRAVSHTAGLAEYAFVFDYEGKAVGLEPSFDSHDASAVLAVHPLRHHLAS